MMIRDSKRNISVAKGHGYTVDKVKFAMEFVQKAGRNTTLADWVNAYNYIKDANETADGCQACKGAKFTAAVRNYAQYGYLTLLNDGHRPEEFVHHPAPAEVNVQKNEVFTEDEQVENVEQTEPIAEEEPKTAPLKKERKNKGGRPKKTTAKKTK